MSSIGSSSPAVLDISAEELHAKIETFKTLLGGTESELGTIVAQQPHLLLADVDDRVREKVLNACVRSNRFCAAVYSIPVSGTVSIPAPCVCDDLNPWPAINTIFQSISVDARAADIGTTRALINHDVNQTSFAIESGARNGVADAPKVLVI